MSIAPVPRQCTPSASGAAATHRQALTLVKFRRFASGASVAGFAPFPAVARPVRGGARSGPFRAAVAADLSGNRRDLCRGAQDHLWRPLPGAAGRRRGPRRTAATNVKTAAGAGRPSCKTFPGGPARNTESVADHSPAHGALARDAYQIIHRVRCASKAQIGDVSSSWESAPLRRARRSSRIGPTRACAGLWSI